MRLILTIIILCVCTLWCTAQNSEKQLYTSYIGLSAKQMKFKNNFESDGYWYGGRFHHYTLYFEYHMGKLHKEGRKELDQTINGFVTSVGANIPFVSYQKSDQLSASSFRIIPSADVGLAYAQAGLNGPEDKNLSWGLKVAPAVMFKFPFGSINLRADAYLLVDRIFLAKTDNDNAFFGTRFAPSIDITIDGLRDILQPEEYEKEIDYKKTVTNEKKVADDVYDWGDIDRDGNTLEKMDIYVKTTKTVDAKEYVFFDIIDNYWHTGARLTTYPQRKLQGATFLYGPTTGFRFGLFALDGFYQKGKYGLRNRATYEELQSFDAPDVNFNLSASQEVQVLGGSFAMDIKKLNVVNKKRVADVFFKQTTFTRVLLKYNFQQIRKTGDLTYSFSDAASRRFENGVVLAPENDPELLQETINLHGMGFALEFGAASVSYDLLFSKKKAPLLNRNSFTFQIGIPIIQTVQKVSRHWKRKKAYRKAKKEKQKD